MAGVTLVPGLIDAHVHMVLDPEIPIHSSRGAVIAHTARRDGPARRGDGACRHHDGAGSWRWRMVGARVARSDRAPGNPRSTIALFRSAGYIDRRPLSFLGWRSGNLADAAAVIARQHEHGVDLIKVMATGGTMTKGTTPRDAQFDQDTLAAIVADARQRGYPIAAHCHGTAGIRHAVRAGVTTIEHCSWVGEAGWAAEYDAEIAALMAARGIWVSPTVNLGWSRHVGSGSDHARRVMGNFAAMRAAGVKFVASTDAGIPNVKHEDLGKALPVFAHLAALTPVDALKTATSGAASAVGLRGMTGQLAVGYAADVLFVDGDPLTDLSCLAAPAGVLARGAPAL